MNTQLGELSVQSSDRRLNCSMTCSCVENEAGELIIRYGLRFRRQSETVRDYPDVSGNAKALRDFMTLLNRNRVSIHHIDDVVADFMAVGAD